MLIIAHMAFPAYSDPGSHKLILDDDLSYLARLSRQTNKPLLLLVSRADCTYCAQIKREILEPMIISGDYADRIIMRELMLDRSNEARGFDGKWKSTFDIASSYGVTITPTLLFLGPSGQELTERVVGISTLELFSYYLDRSIDEAILRLKTNTTSR